MRLTWLGQGGFLFEAGGKRLAVDPYLTDSLRKKGFTRLILPPMKPEDLNAEAIVCTHDHGDHFDPETILGMLSASLETLIVGPASVATLGKELGMTVETLKVGDQPLELGPFVIRAMPAFHSDPEAIGLLIEVDRCRIYLTGDSMCSDQLANAAGSDGPVDLLLICVNGKLGNMSAEEAVEVAKSLRPSLTIPMHYGMFAENTVDPGTFFQPAKAAGLRTTALEMGKSVGFNVP